MNTRNETIGYVTYCSYCGKILEDCSGICVSVRQSLVCNCDKAKKELQIYDDLKSLYKEPIAEKLIDIKVNKYRNELLGINEPMRLSDLCCISGADYPTAQLQATFDDTNGTNISLTTL